MTKTEKEQYIKHLEIAGNNLLQQAADLRAGVDRNKCARGEYTNIPFKGCKTCGNTVRVKCKFQKVGFVNSGGCFPYNEITKKGCKNFKSLILTRNTQHATH